MGRRQRLENINNRTYIHDLLKSYLLGGFKWEGLPQGLTSQQLEQFITTQGLAVGFNHPEAGPVILPSVWGAPLNIYFLPNFYIAYGAGFERRVDVDDAITFYDNSSRRGLRPLCDHTEAMLMEIVGAQKVNIAHQKNPWIFAGTETEKQSLLAAIATANENNPVVITTNSAMLNIDTAKRFFPTNVPFIGQEFEQAFRQNLNQFLTVLGYDNVAIEKKERLITDEAHANDSSVMYHRMDRLRAREKACNEFNSKFGTSLSVKWVGCSDCENSAIGGENE